MEKNKLITLGLVIVGSIFIFIWGLNFLKGKDLFKTELHYIAIYPKVNGLTNSSIIEINGIKIGQIEEIYFTSPKKESVTVKMMVESEYAVPKNSTAEIYSADLMGTKAIRIKTYDTTAIATDMDTLKASIEGDLIDQVNMQVLPLKQKAEDMMGSIDSLLTVVQAIFNEATQENLTQSFTSIKRTIRNLENTTFTIDTLMTEQKYRFGMIIGNVASITQNIKNNNEELTNIIKNFSQISDTIAKSDIAGVIAHTDSTLNQFNHLLSQINSGNGSLSELLHNDTLYRNLENSAYNLNLLVKDLKDNPKRYVRFSLIDLSRTPVEKPEKNEKQK